MKLLQKPKTIYYVTDKASWSFDWDAHYITRGLKQAGDVRTKTVGDWRGISGQILHFGDRYAFFRSDWKEIARTNKVFLTWFHGDPKDPNPDMQRMFERLPEAAKVVRKFVVTCSISENVLVAAGIPRVQIERIPLGVDLDQFKPIDLAARNKIRRRLGVPQNATCIGSFQKDGSGWDAGLEPKWVKGPDVLLETLARLKVKHSNLFVLLTGPSRGYMKAGLERLGIPYKHDYLKNYLDLVPYYQASDLYLITSRSEGGPKALLESWATKVPVISTRVGMACDLIRHHQNGLLTDVDDVEHLTALATKVIESPALQTHLTQEALRDVMNYDWLRVAEQYYSRLFSEK